MLRGLIKAEISTNSTEHSHPSKAVTVLANREIHSILLNPKVGYRVHNGPSGRPYPDTWILTIHFNAYYSTIYAYVFHVATAQGFPTKLCMHCSSVPVLLVYSIYSTASCASPSRVPCPLITAPCIPKFKSDQNKVFSYFNPFWIAIPSHKCLFTRTLL